MAAPRMARPNAGLGGRKHAVAGAAALGAARGSDYSRAKPRTDTHHGRTAAPTIAHWRGADGSGAGRSQGQRLGAGDFGQRRHLAFAQSDAGVGAGAARSRYGLG